MGRCRGLAGGVTDGPGRRDGVIVARVKVGVAHRKEILVGNEKNDGEEDIIRQGGTAKRLEGRHD